MTNITASLVKELRDKTGAGMMDCKTALTETNGDVEAAIDWLRKKGLSKAAKKAGRVAAEGLIGLHAHDDAGALIEVNSETDFVARNDQFKEFVRDAAALALLAEGDLEKLLANPMGATSMREVLTAMIATIGENMSVRRAAVLGVTPGIVASYVHNAVGPELGKIGVLVALRSSGDKQKLATLGRQLAMHVAFAAPLALNPNELPADVVERERSVQADIARQSGKPEALIEKMLEGRMRKFYEESVLLSQVFQSADSDGKATVAQVVQNLAKQLGTSVEVTGFLRFAVGEGIEKETADFAAEVNSVAGR